MLEFLVLRVHRHARVAEHRLGTGGGDHDVAAAVGERIADVPEIAGLVGVLHLRIGQGGQTVRAPVDDAAALVNKSLFIQLAEGLAHGAGATLVHGEAVAAPVAGRTHFLLLLDNAAAILLLPRPDALKEFLTPQIVAGQALLVAQLLLHLDLGGNARVVAAGQPKSLVALHTLEAGQDVLQGAVQRVTHVELPRNIGGRHDDGKRLFVGIWPCLEAVTVHPQLVDAGFHLPRVVDLWQFFHIRAPFSVIRQNKKSALLCLCKTGRTKMSVVPPVFGIYPRSWVQKHPAPVTEGDPSQPTVSSVRGSGTTWAAHRGHLHRPCPLSASADRLLLPVIACFVWGQYTISAGKCQEGDRR